jgi:hypothetical protein
MNIHNNFLNADQILILRKCFDQHVENNDLNFKYWITHKDTIKEVFHSDADQIVQQERRDVASKELGNYTRLFLKSIIDIPADTNIWAVRSHAPIGIHTDSDDVLYQQGRTIIIPLTFDDRIVTLVWDKVLTQKQLQELFQSFASDPTNFEKLNNSSQQYQLDNCWFGDPCLTDFLPLLGVAKWQLGTIIEFDRQIAHASNNYTKFIPFKDYLLIHTDEPR